MILRPFLLVFWGRECTVGSLSTNNAWSDLGPPSGCRGVSVPSGVVPQSNSAARLNSPKSFLYVLRPHSVLATLRSSNGSYRQQTHEIDGITPVKLCASCITYLNIEPGTRSPLQDRWAPNINALLVVIELKCIEIKETAYVPSKTVTCCGPYFHCQQESSGDSNTKKFAHCHSVGAVVLCCQQGSSSIGIAAKRAVESCDNSAWMSRGSSTTFISVINHKNI